LKTNNVNTLFQRIEEYSTAQFLNSGLYNAKQLCMTASAADKLKDVIQYTYPSQSGKDSGRVAWRSGKAEFRSSV
jgi:hypothetical protein